MKIRYATNYDFDFLIEGMKEIRVAEKNSIRVTTEDRKDYRKAIKNKTIRIIERGGKPVAFLYFKLNFKVMYMKGKFLWVQRIYVKKKYRGKGLGKLLYKDAVRIAKKKGLKKIVIDVFDANKNSIIVHKRLKFEPIYTIYEKRI